MLPPGTIITSLRSKCDVNANSTHLAVTCGKSHSSGGGSPHLWLLSLANGRAGLGGIIQSGGRDTGSGLADILNVSKYYRPEVRTSGKPLHRYLVTGALTSLRISPILKSMLEPSNEDIFYDNFTLSSSFLGGFPVHVWVSHAGHRREQMWALPAPATGVTMTSRVTWLKARDCHAATQSVITQPRHK